MQTVGNRKSPGRGIPGGRGLTASVRSRGAHTDYLSTEWRKLVAPRESQRPPWGSCHRTRPPILRTLPTSYDDRLACSRDQHSFPRRILAVSRVGTWWILTLPGWPALQVLWDDRSPGGGAAQPNQEKGLSPGMQGAAWTQRRGVGPPTVPRCCERHATQEWWVPASGGSETQPQVFRLGGNHNINNINCTNNNTRMGGVR